MKVFSPLILATLLAINAFLSQTPPESPELKEASELNTSALNLFKERRYSEALSLAKQALAIREKLLPRTDPRVSTSLGYLADIYLVTEDFDNARRVLERLLEIQIERSGPDDVSLAPTLDRLALVHYRKKNRSKAQELYERAFAAREKTFGSESLPVAQSLFALGEFYRLERDFARATSSYKRSLLIYGKLSGIESHEFERASDAFACVGYQTDRLAVFKQLNEIRKQFAPPQTPKELIERPVFDSKVLSLPLPDDPVGTHDERGVVVIKIEIDERGRVSTANDMCQAPPNIRKASLEAARKARFTPTKVLGKPVKVTALILYTFY